jgi:hypothetical protein
MNRTAFKGLVFGLVTLLFVTSTNQALAERSPSWGTSQAYQFLSRITFDTSGNFIIPGDLTIANAADTTKRLKFNTTNITTANSVTVIAAGTATEPLFGLGDVDLVAGWAVDGGTQMIIDNETSSSLQIGTGTATSADRFSALQVWAENYTVGTFYAAWGVGQAGTWFGSTRGGTNEVRGFGGPMKVGTATNHPLILGTVNAPRFYFEDAAKALTAGNATAFVEVAVPQGTVVGGVVEYVIQANDATNFQSRTGVLVFSVVNPSGTEVCTLARPDGGTTVDNTTDLVAVSSGTLTNTFTCTVGLTDAVRIAANAASSLTETTLQISYSVRLNGGTTGGVTPQ